MGWKIRELMQTIDVFLFSFGFHFLFLLFCQTGEMLSADTAVTFIMSEVELMFLRNRTTETKPQREKIASYTGPITLLAAFKPYQHLKIAPQSNGFCSHLSKAKVAASMLILPHWACRIRPSPPTNSG